MVRRSARKLAVEAHNDLGTLWDALADRWPEIDSYDKKTLEMIVYPELKEAIHLAGKVRNFLEHCEWSKRRGREPKK